MDGGNDKFDTKCISSIGGSYSECPPDMILSTVILAYGWPVLHSTDFPQPTKTLLDSDIADVAGRSVTIKTYDIGGWVDYLTQHRPWVAIGRLDLIF